MPADNALQPVKNIINKIQNNSPTLQYCWCNHRYMGCIRFCDMSVVLDFALNNKAQLDPQAELYFQHQVILFLINRIFRAKPFAPSAFEGIDFRIALVYQLLCQTGTGVFIRSGAIQNEGLVLGVCLRPFIKFFRVGPTRPLNLEFG